MWVLAEIIKTSFRLRIATCFYGNLNFMRKKGETIPAWDKPENMINDWKLNRLLLWVNCTVFIGTLSKLY